MLGLACAALLGWQMVLRPVVNQLRQLRRAALAQASSTRRWRGHRGRRAARCWRWCCWCRGRSARWCRASSGRPNRRSCAPTSRASSAASSGRTARRCAPASWCSRCVNHDLQTELVRQRARVAALEAALFDALPGGDAPGAGERPRRRCARRTVGGAGRARAADAARRRTRGAGAGRRTAGAARGRRPAGALHRARQPGRPGADRRAADGARRAARSGGGRAGRLERAGQRAAGRFARREVHPAQPAARQRRCGAASCRAPRWPSATAAAIATDPADASDLKPLQPVVLLDVQLDAGGGTAAGRIGERAAVRFDAGFAPLAWQGAAGAAARRFASSSIRSSEPAHGHRAFTAPARGAARTRPAVGTVPAARADRSGAALAASGAAAVAPMLYRRIAAQAQAGAAHRPIQRRRPGAAGAALAIAPRGSAGGTDRSRAGVRGCRGAGRAAA